MAVFLGPEAAEDQPNPYAYIPFLIRRSSAGEIGVWTSTESIKTSRSIGPLTYGFPT